MNSVASVLLAVSNSSDLVAANLGSYTRLLECVFTPKHSHTFPTYAYLNSYTEIIYGVNECMKSEYVASHATR